MYVGRQCRSPARVVSLKSVDLLLPHVERSARCLFVNAMWSRPRQIHGHRDAGTAHGIENEVAGLGQRLDGGASDLDRHTGWEGVRERLLAPAVVAADGDDVRNAHDFLGRSTPRVGRNLTEVAQRSVAHVELPSGRVPLEMHVNQPHPPNVTLADCGSGCKNASAKSLSCRRRGARALTG